MLVEAASTARATVRLVIVVIEVVMGPVQTDMQPVVGWEVFSY